MKSDRTRLSGFGMFFCTSGELGVCCSATAVSILGFTTLYNSQHYIWMPVRICQITDALSRFRKAECLVSSILCRLFGLAHVLLHMLMHRPLLRTFRQTTQAESYRTICKETNQCALADASVRDIKVNSGQQIQASSFLQSSRSANTPPTNNMREPCSAPGPPGTNGRREGGAVLRAMAGWP